MQDSDLGWPENALENLYNALAEETLRLTHDELVADAIEDGIDPVQAAETLRQRMLSAIDQMSLGQ
jgi:hypothetical protein